MEGKDYKLFIVEGEKRELEIIDNLCGVFFKHANFKVISLPAGQNIYMLWKKMKQDDFETDIIEVLRENDNSVNDLLEGIPRNYFSEVYLFFDYDVHQKNLTSDERGIDVIAEMLETFDNETEMGKLYISYPMVEALRDYEGDRCGNINDCYFLIKNSNHYKEISAKKQKNLSFSKYTYREWFEIINVFAMRVSCFLNEGILFTYTDYGDCVAPMVIYQKEKEEMERERVFILSAFPEFLLDYHKMDFWNSRIKTTGKFMQQCKGRCK